jgi:hypothetical protein
MMELIEEIDLANGLKLQIMDLSRSIAADTVKIEILFQTKIALLESYFADAGDYCRVRNAFGDELTYESRHERSFVRERSQDSVRAELINTFKNNSLQYLSAENFSRKLSLSKLRDIKNNPYKYRKQI